MEDFNNCLTNYKMYELIAVQQLLPYLNSNLILTNEYLSNAILPIIQCVEQMRQYINVSTNSELQYDKYLFATTELEWLLTQKFNKPVKCYVFDDDKIGFSENGILYELVNTLCYYSHPMNRRMRKCKNIDPPTINDFINYNHI